MSVCPQVIDDKSYRRRIFNECVSEEFLKDEMWLGFNIWGQRERNIQILG